MDNSKHIFGDQETDPLMLAQSLDDSPDLVALTSMDGPIRYMNRTGRELLQIEELGPNMSFRQFRPAWAVNLLLEEIVATATATGSWKGESVLKAVDGTEISVYQSVTILCNRAGDPENMLVVARPYVDRKDSEKETHDYDAYYRLFFQKSAEAIYLLDVVTKRVLLANPVFFDMLGYAREELASLHIYDFVFHDRASIDGFLEKIWDSREMFLGERQWKCKDGSVIDVAVGLTLITNAGKPVYMVTARDISAERAAEKKLRQSEARYRLLVEHLNDGLVQVDTGCEILFVNDRLCELTGYSRDELLGRISYEVLMGGEGGKEMKSRMIDPSPGGEKTQHHEIQIRLKSGELRWFQNSTTQVRDARGRIVGAIGLLRDIQEQKEIDRRLQFKIRELDTFVYKASHDLKAPLNSLQGLLNLAIQENEEPIMHRYLELMNKKTTKLHSVLMGLLEVSMMQEGKVRREEILLMDLVEEIFESFDVRVGIVLKNSISPDFVVQTDRKILESSIQNLVHNAVNYHRDAGTDRFVEVSVEKGSEHNRICVRDNGPGIPEEIRDKVFDMFYRGSNDSEGSGLGLYIVKTAAEKLGGKVKLKSKVGEGTQFTISIPYQY